MKEGIVDTDEKDNVSYMKFIKGSAEERFSWAESGFLTVMHPYSLEGWTIKILGTTLAIREPLVSRKSLAFSAVLNWKCRFGYKSILYNWT